MQSLLSKSVAILAILVGLLPSRAVAFFDPFDFLMHTELPLLIGQQPSNKFGEAEEFKEYCESDTSNDEIGRFTAQQIIERSGYKFENHYVMSDDGYVTEIIRIVNPLADKTRLKQPPIMLLHGGTIDPAAYVWASAIQHKPEPWPRAEDSGPITSWNRSLGFMLANNGWDVWLIGTRGSDTKNEGHIKYHHEKSIDLAGESSKRQAETPIEKMAEARQFWSFTMDDIIEFEVPRQIDRVLSLTGARKVILYSYSQSTLITLTLLAEHPDYADKVHGLVSMAPVINDIGANRLSKFGLRTMCGLLPDDVGIMLYSEILLTKMLREVWLRVNQNKYLRYTLLKPILNVMFGASAKYLTLLEPAVIGHSFMPLGFVQLKQCCQQVMKKRFQKFDYGPVQNEIKYGKLKPPRVNLTDLHIDHWVVVSGSRDNFAPPASVNQILSEVKSPEPYKHIKVKGYNHLDLVAAMTNDIEINLPILEFFDRIQMPPLSSEKRDATRKKKDSEDNRLKEFVPTET